MPLTRHRMNGPPDARQDTRDTAAYTHTGEARHCAANAFAGNAMSAGRACATVSGNRFRDGRDSTLPDGLSSLKSDCS
jgi:hypothetical protein